jgi:hypothetical protein
MKIWNLTLVLVTLAFRLHLLYLLNLGGQLNHFFQKKNTEITLPLDKALFMLNSDNPNSIYDHRTNTT